jgi:hypothetical protein
MSLRAQLGSLFLPLLLHNYNATTAASRAAVVKELGVAGVAPAPPGSLYPGSSVTSTVNHMSGGWGKGALLGTAILATGILGTLLGPGLLRTTPALADKETKALAAKETPSAPPPTAPVAAEGDYVTWAIQPDGTRKEIGRVHVRTLPTGQQEQRQPDGTWAPFQGVK